MKLLSIGTNAKTLKSDNSGKGYLTAILYLAPAKTSGKQVCPNSSQGCRASCLFTAGRGQINMVQEARIKKTNLWFNDRKLFVKCLNEDLTKLVKKCESLNVQPSVRLNGTSDIPFCLIKDTKDIFQKFNQVQFYDYTKIQSYMKKYMNGNLPQNLHLTFSKSEHNWIFCQTVLKNKCNVSAVFENLPKKYKDYKVFNGDETDLRFLDKFGICGLTAKGKAKKDQTGFVIRNLK